MSAREKRQKALVLLIGALVIAVIAASIGFATGYGAESKKRMALVEENEALTLENESLNNVKINLEEMESLKTENANLKEQVQGLETKVKGLEEELAKTKDDLAKSEATLDETRGALSEAEEDMEAYVTKTEEGPQGLMSTITMWFIFGIIAVVVIMGVALFVVPKARKKKDEDDEYADEDFSEEDVVSEDEPLAPIDDPVEEEVKVYDEEAERARFEEEIRAIKEEGLNNKKVPETLEELMLESSKEE